MNKKILGQKLNSGPLNENWFVGGILRLIYQEFKINQNDPGDDKGGLTFFGSGTFLAKWVLQYVSFENLQDAVLKKLDNFFIRVARSLNYFEI